MFGWLGLSRTRVYHPSRMDEVVGGHGQRWWLVNGCFSWTCCRCAGGGRAASFLAWSEVDAVGLKFLLGSGQIVRSSLQGAKGGTFGCGRGMGLELLSEEADKWCVEGASGVVFESLGESVL